MIAVATPSGLSLATTILLQFDDVTVARGDLHNKAGLGCVSHAARHFPTDRS
jgi:hypothetical protein